MQTSRFAEIGAVVANRRLEFPFIEAKNVDEDTVMHHRRGYVMQTMNTMPTIFQRILDAIDHAVGVQSASSATASRCRSTNLKDRPFHIKNVIRFDLKQQ